MDAGHTQERPPRHHKTQSPGTIKTGSSRLTDASQAIHSRSNCHGRQSSVVASGSPAPERNPTRPPSTFAAAVAGNGVPAVRRLKTIQGVRMAEGTPHAIAVRDEVTGPPSHRSGTSNTDSGRARAASPTSAADSATTTPASFAHAGWAPPSLNIPARRRVQRGAVEPATGTPGL